MTKGKVTGEDTEPTPLRISPPVVSIVVPTRNRPESLACCLNALATQTLPAGSFEVIVIDDGSEPPVHLDPAKWSSKMQLRLIRQENTGPAGARNRGAAEAVGQLLAFTDDDCLPTPTWLETLVAALSKHPEALVGGSTFNGLQENLFSETSQFILDLVYEHFNQEPENAYFFASNTIAVRRDLCRAFGGFDSEFGFPAGEDRDFCDRWRSMSKPLVWEKRAVVEHRHPQGLADFCRVYRRYGEGAYLYALKRRKRGSGTMAHDLAFHRSWPARSMGKLARYPVNRRIRILGNLVLWQVMNAWGFVAAWWRAFSK